MTADLQERLGWFFQDPDRLSEALTHSTFANENPGSGPDNERLEYLGDAVLDLLVAAILYESHQEMGEGEMSRRRARVVRQSALADLARGIGVGEHLRLGVGQHRSGQTESILADAYEALVGAVFVDGGYEAVLRCFFGPLARALDAANEIVDFKTRIQELCHRLGDEPPEYVLLEVTGPDHDRRFSCEVRIGDRTLGTGSASTKKAAEQICAERAMEELGSMPEEKPRGIYEDV